MANLNSLDTSAVDATTLSRGIERRRQSILLLGQRFNGPGTKSHTLRCSRGARHRSLYLRATKLPALPSHIRCPRAIRPPPLTESNICAILRPMRFIRPGSIVAPASPGPLRSAVHQSGHLALACPRKGRELTGTPMPDIEPEKNRASVHAASTNPVSVPATRFPVRTAQNQRPGPLTSSPRSSPLELGHYMSFQSVCMGVPADWYTGSVKE